MNPLLLRRARKLLAEASVIAEAPGVSFIPSGRHEHEGKEPTTGTGHDTFSHYAPQLANCRTDSDLHGFVERLGRVLDGIRKRPLAPKVKLKMEVLYGCWSDHHYTAVERASGVSARTIRRWRVDAGQDPNDGQRRAA